MSDEEIKDDQKNQKSKEEVKPEPTYRDYVKDMLDKVSSGEKVLEEPPKDTTGELLSDKGVKDGIRQIFNDGPTQIECDPNDKKCKEKEVVKESIEEEVEELQKSEREAEDDSPKEVSPSSFDIVSSKNDAPDLFPQWEKAKMYLRRIGKDVDDGLGYVVRRVEGRDDEPATITVKLAKYKERDGVPYMMVSFDEDDDSTPAELAIPYIENVGISVNKDTVYEAEDGKYIYFEFDA